MKGLERGSNMKKSLIFIGCLYLVSCGDYHVSNIVFNRYCNDKEFVGQFIYERIGLTKELFQEIPKDGSRLFKTRTSLYIENRKHLIDEKKFNALYSYRFSKRTKLFPVGPIYLTETTVTRKSDNKLLGKSVSLTNKKGWLSETNLVWLNTGDKCPIYRSEHGLNLVNTDHSSLIRNIFYKHK